jgi:hypothetical protein
MKIRSSMINPSKSIYNEKSPKSMGQNHGAVTLIHSYNIPLYIQKSYLT